jgi:hypothetical protein
VHFRTRGASTLSCVYRSSKDGQVSARVESALEHGQKVDDGLAPRHGAAIYEANGLGPLPARGSPVGRNDMALICGAAPAFCWGPKWLLHHQQALGSTDMSIPAQRDTLRDETPQTLHDVIKSTIK